MIDLDFPTNSSNGVLFDRSRLVNVEDINGVIADGVTDCRLQIQSKIDSLAATATKQKQAVIYFPSGQYALSAPLILRGWVSVRLEVGATLIARSNWASVTDNGISVQGMLCTDTDYGTPAGGGNFNNRFYEGNIVGYGQLVCGQRAAYGVQVVKGRFGRYKNFKVLGAAISGFRCDPPVGESKPTGGDPTYALRIGELVIENDNVAASISGVGVDLQACTDMRLFEIEIIGYPIGLRIGGYTGSGNYAYDVHPWCRAVHGGMFRGFDISNRKIKLFGCHADTPAPNAAAGQTEGVGFYLNNRNIQLIGCEAFLNSDPEIGADNTAIGIDGGGNQLGGCVINGFNLSSGTVKRWARDLVNYVDGSFEGYNVEDATIVTPSSIGTSYKQGYRVRKALGANLDESVVRQDGQTTRRVWIRRFTAGSGTGDNGQNCQFIPVGDDGTLRTPALDIPRAENQPIVIGRGARLRSYTRDELINSANANYFAAAGKIGTVVWCSNGRDTGQGGGNGTGVLAISDGTTWKAIQTNNLTV